MNKTNIKKAAGTIIVIAVAIVVAGLVANWMEARAVAKADAKIVEENA